MADLDDNAVAPLTTSEELYQKLDRPELCLIDTRPAEEFAHAHIPGALHLDLFGISLVDTTPAPLKAFMWMIRHLFELRGVDRSKHVILYEDVSGMRGARAFWFLEYFGHPKTQLLDGGMRAWRKQEYPITTQSAAPKSAQFSIADRGDVLATVDDVRRSLGQEGVCILDTRSDAEYLGQNVRAARGGAIPGAVHLEWTHNLDADGRFKKKPDLESMYRDRGITPDKEIIPYCQGGYRSSHSYLALKLIGYPQVRNYIGSWKEWGDRSDLPIEKPSQ